MGLRGIKDIDRDDVADFVWKWRCKILPDQESTIPKTADLDSLDDDDSKEKNTKSGKDPTFGSDATIKTLYEGRNSSSCSFDWVDYPPKQISKSAARAQDRVAIKAYKIKDREKPCISGRHPLRYHEIEIQNPLLVAALEPIVKKEDVHLDTNENATFSHPFRALWFCQDDITALYKKKDASDPLKTYLSVLLRLMEDIFQELRLRTKHLKASGLVDFKHAWTLFPKDAAVYSYGLNSEFLVKTDSTYYVTRQEGEYLIIKGKIMTFNGEEFVWQDKLLAIKKYAGNKPVAELDSFPLEFHPDAAAIKARCVRRGKKMLDYQGLTYCCYNGIALHQGQETSKHNVEGRVLIDVMGYNRYHLAQGNRENQDDTDKNRVGRRGTRSRKMRAEEPSDEDQAVKETQKSRLSDEEQVSNKKDMMSREDDLGFMSELIGGYALKNKLWVRFYVEDLTPMVWNDGAYEHLVYDRQQKDLVLSFVENHNTHVRGGGKPSNMEDVIRGKGNGLILLLSGPPGTGKTLTAEAVADRTHRPLFYLQAEDLGINAASLGANIKRVFEMATDWDAVVLLDEADVFMAERNPNDIHRNELVSIFLRELEYFRGIIFLTTNLYHTIDSAFRSRVNLHLLFQSLSKEARETVWRKFLDRMPEAKALPPAEGSSEDRPLDDEDIKELSLWQLNGREIKNAVKMVRSWCDHKGYMLTLDRLENGIKVTSPHASKDGDVDGDLYE